MSRRDEGSDDWWKSHVLDTLNDLNWHVGQFGGELRSMRDEVINRINRLEERERQRERAPAARSSFFKDLTWRDVAGLLTLIILGLLGHGSPEQWLRWVVLK